MTTWRIDTHIPIPSNTRARRLEPLPLERLDIGHSLLVTDRSRSAVRQAAAAYKQEVSPDTDFIVRKVGTYNRIWRTK